MIKNHTENNSDSHINAMRKAFEHRATWFALLVEAAKERGVDISFARDAITKCGCLDGTNKFDPNCTDINEFTKVFATDDIKKIFDMECKARDLYSLRLKNPDKCGKEMTEKIIIK